MQIKPTPNIEEPSETNGHLEVSAEAAQSALALPAPPANRTWDRTTEQEWSEHSTTAWALAHVIHRICSTPLPPVLPPEQRRHFQKVVQMAAALMEEWQRRERDQAQQLVAGRPLADTQNEAPIERRITSEEQSAEELAQTVVAVSEQE